MASLPEASFVLAVMMTMEALSRPMFVMNCLVPLMTHASPSSTAVVRVAAASEPAPGSVNPKAPICLPWAMGTSHLRFCASEPNTNSSCPTTLVVTSRSPPSVTSALEISSMQRCIPTQSPPLPPY